MRSLFAAVSLAALAFATSAAAAPIALAPVSFSPELQADLTDRLGEREGAYLQRAVTDAVTEALTRAGAEVSGSAPVTVEITILDADPNRPTFAQLGSAPYLDFRSISIGGAELRAVLKTADGSVISEVTHRRYSHSIDDISLGAATWSDARRAINQFATRVAEAYTAHVAGS